MPRQVDAAIQVGGETLPRPHRRELSLRVIPEANCQVKPRLEPVTASFPSPTARRAASSPGLLGVAPEYAFSAIVLGASIVLGAVLVLATLLVRKCLALGDLG